MTRKTHTILIAGASGVVGAAAVEHFRMQTAGLLPR